MTRFVPLALLLALGCEERPCPVVPVCPRLSASTPSAPASMSACASSASSGSAGAPSGAPPTVSVKLSAVPFCTADEKTILLHVIIPTQWRPNAAARANGDEDRLSRRLWSISCSNAVGQWSCSAARLRVEEVEAHGGLVGFFDLGAVGEPIRVAASTHTTATVRVGPLILFNIDTVKGHVDYIESGPNGEARGGVDCGASVR